MGGNKQVRAALELIDGVQPSWEASVLVTRRNRVEAVESAGTGVGVGVGVGVGGGGGGLWLLVAWGDFLLSRSLSVFSASMGGACRRLRPQWFSRRDESRSLKKNGETPTEQAKSGLKQSEARRSGFRFVWRQKRTS